MQVRLRHMGYAALTAGLAVTLGACHRAPPSLAPKTVPVAVEVRCSGNQTFVSVDPWLLELNLGDAAEWSLRPNSTVYSVDVAPKQGPWPFKGNPQHGNATNPARSGGAASVHGRHKYTITAICGTQDQPGQTVVIDPDMDIK
jgi:hypothetical protein